MLHVEETLCHHELFRLDWICLTTTRPSGHISGPTQVNVYQSCFNSLYKLHKLNYIVQVCGLIEVNCVTSERRILLLAGIPLCMSRELSRRGFQWDSCVVFDTTFLYHCTLQEHMVNAECLTLLYCIKLHASFESHQWIRTEVTFRKR